MQPSASIERRIPKTLLFGAPIVALSWASVTPSSDVASVSNSATSRIAERAREPSAPGALSGAGRAFDARRTNPVLNGRDPPCDKRGGTVEASTSCLNSPKPDAMQLRSRQTAAAAAATVSHQPPGGNDGHDARSRIAPGHPD